MSEGEQITLEGQAVEEILREAKRSKELAYDLGATGWRKRDVLPNKRFLNNTLVSTLRHSYRQDKKHRIGSNKKYHDHMKNKRSRGRNYYRNHGDREREEVIEPEPDGPEPDYGEFDAIAYSEKCTDLYIRDSHRKHSFMKGNFVEKHHKGSSSESEESYTEYDDSQRNRHHTEGYKSKWSDTGSADEYDAGFEETSKRNLDDEKQHSHRKERGESQRQKDSKKNWTNNRTGHFSKDKQYKRKDYDRSHHNAGTSGHSETREYARQDSAEHYQSIKKVRKEKEFIPESDEDSDKECLNSGTESADNTEKTTKNKGRGKKSRKILNDGKNLWEKISSRSMYADIEEIKMKKDSGILEHIDKKENSRHSRQMKLDRDERRQRYLKQKEDEEEAERIAELKREKEEKRDEAERIRKEESLKRLADRKRKETEMQHDAERQRNEMEMRRMADMHWQEEQMRLAAFEHFRGRFPRRPFRGRPFMRGRPFLRGRPPRGFRGGFPAFPPMNPFYASFFNEIDPYLLEKFIKEYGHKLIRKSKRHGHNSESRSRSRSRSGRHKKTRRHYSDSDTSHSRDRSKSRSRRHSSRYSSSYSRSRSRSYSRHRSRDRTKSGSRRRSGNHARSGSRRRSRESSRSRSRSHRYSSDRYSRSRSRSHSRNRRSDSPDPSKSSDSHRSSSERSYSRSRRKHKRSRKHKKSKHRKHSKSKKKSKKSSESENEESSASDNDLDNKSNIEESEKSADNESDIEGSEKSVENEEYSDTYNEPEEGEVSEGEIVSDDNGGLETVSDEESGEAWSSSSDGAIE